MKFLDSMDFIDFMEHVKMSAHPFDARATLACYDPFGTKSQQLRKQDDWELKVMSAIRKGASPTTFAILNP